jgi:outer membrane protein
MKRTLLIIILLSVLSVHESHAQKKWTLMDCINYAVSNNIQLQRQRLLTENEKVNLLKSKMDMLPNLSFESDGRLGFGRSVNPVTNLITFEQNVSNSYSLSSNYALFNGFANLNTVSANKFMLNAGVEAEKVATNTLVLNILSAYHQVLYAKGIENAAKMQYELSQKQLFRIQKTVETGRESLSSQYEMESRCSGDKLAYTVAVNTTSQAITALKQILELDPGTEFDIAMPDLDNFLISDEIFKTDSIYNIAAETLPRLKAINYELMAMEKQVASAKGRVYPRLSVGGAIYTGFYKVFREDAAMEQAGFWDQMKNNNSQALYMSLQVPLFSNYTTGRNIRLAKIRLNDTELKLELEKNNLYTDIENACLEYNRGKDEYAAARANFEFNKKSFEVVEKKFESGLVDVTDYSAAGTTLFRAETEALRTKLQLLLRRISIQFYSTGDYQNMINFK